MPAHKKYDSLEAKKAADAKRKRDKRANDKTKKLKLEAESNFEWIHKLTTKIANQIPNKANQMKAKKLKLRDRKRKSR